VLAAEDDAGSGGTFAVQDVAQKIAAGPLAMARAWRSRASVRGVT